MATQYQKRMMLRKNSDLTRLAEQFKKNIETSTGEYESAFAAYQKNVAEQMAPYEAASKQYKEIQMPAYESAKAAYEQKLNKFNAQLEELERNPTQPKESFKVVQAYPGGVWSLQPTGVNDVIFITDAALFDRVKKGEYTKSGGSSIKRGDVIYTQESKPVPKFSGKAPSAPTAPQVPQVAGFDEAQFEQKRGQLQQEFQREVGERKGARLAVVGRKGSRPLMQDK
jgi:hypothetical protein